MSSLLAKILGPNFKTVAVHGRFFPQGTGAVVNSSNKGKGFTVTRTGVGVYQLVFTTASLIDLQAIVGNVQAVTAGVPASVVFGAFNTATRTILVNVYTESAGTLAPADLAANADNSVSFVALFKGTAA